MLLRIVLLTTLMAGGASAQATHRTAGGAEIVLEPVESMDCPEMGAKMAEIDASGYRSGGPDSAAAGDKPLLDYENALSARYFKDCVRSEEDNGEAGALSFSSDG